MRTRFERDIDRRTACALAGGAQRMHFRVRLAGTFVPAFAHHNAIAHDHTTHARIRRGRIQPASRQRQRARHETVMVLILQ